jgi:3-deoxy-D-manno-octulosonic-acid transferase
MIVTKRNRYGMKNRMGLLPERIKNIASKNKVIWVHAVSVGEMKAAGILAPLLRKAFPLHTLIFSTVTHTGNKVARTIAAEKEGVFYLPFDISFITDKVVKAIRPEIFISMETEFWPNLVDSLFKSSAKLVLANGRISNRSYSRYKKCKFFTSRLLEKFSLVLMQSGKDAERIIELGALEEKVSVTGNLKFDIPLMDFSDKRLEIRKKLCLDENEILIIAGSTHRGEEEFLIDCLARLKKEYSGVRLLIAPRHIERTQEIERLLIKNGFEFMRISEIASPAKEHGGLAMTSEPKEPVFILDTIGELRLMYSAADIVFVGGSLIKKGGQNPIEPASMMKPIIFGKYMFNFHDVVKIFIENNSAVQVDDKEGLCLALKLFMDNPIYRNKLGANAKNTIIKNSGSAQKTISCILKQINLTREAGEV